MAKRFLAIFHPPARFEQTIVFTETGGERFRSHGRVLIDAGWRRVYGEVETATEKDDEDDEQQSLPALEPEQPVHCPEVEVLAKQTKPPARYTESSLLRAMETAGKLVEDDEAAEAMKESGLGTPATRAATIERLIDTEYLLREGKPLRATDKGLGLIRMLGDHQLTRPDLTGVWEKRLLDMEAGREQRVAFMTDIQRFTTDTVKWFADKDRSAMRLERREIGPCPRCDGTIVERPKSYSCTSWKSSDEPGCGFTIWKQVGGRTISPEEAAEMVKEGKSSDDIALRARRDRALPHGGLRRRDRRARQELRLHVVEEPNRGRLRLRDLEASARRQGGRHGRGGPRAAWPPARPTRRCAPRSPSARARPRAAAARSSRTRAPSAARRGRAGASRAAGS